MIFENVRLDSKNWDERKKEKNWHKQNFFRSIRFDSSSREKTKRSFYFLSFNWKKTDGGIYKHKQMFEGNFSKSHRHRGLTFTSKPSYPGFESMLLNETMRKVSQSWRNIGLLRLSYPYLARVAKLFLRNRSMGFYIFTL